MDGALLSLYWGKAYGPMTAPVTLTLALSHRGRGDTTASPALLDTRLREYDGVLAGMTVHPHPSAPGIPRSRHFVCSRPFRFAKGASPSP